jgi:hypothetical protein
MADDLAMVDPKAPKTPGVRMWRNRGAIPARAFRMVADAAYARGYPEVTVRLLDELRKKPNGREDRPEEAESA